MTPDTLTDEFVRAKREHEAALLADPFVQELASALRELMDSEPDSHSWSDNTIRRATKSADPVLRRQAAAFLRARALLSRCEAK